MTDLMFAARRIGVSPAEAQIILRLLDGGCNWVSVEELQHLPSMHNGRPYIRSREVVAVHACNIRAKLGARFIIGYPGRGYILSAAAAAQVRCALAAHEEAIAS